MLIGGQKCGTTSLYRYLEAHPDVAWSTPKEVHFFDKHYRRGLDFYRSHFPSRLEAGVSRWVRGRRLLVGEGTPEYLVHPHAPRRASRTLPGARFVVLVRNPVDRAWSHYRMTVRKGRATRSFEESIASQIERLGSTAIDLKKEWKFRYAEAGDRAYLAKGIYADGLANWWRRLPRERFLVLHSADLFARPEETYASVLSFLGLRPWQPESFGRFNAERVASLDPALRRRLADFFRPHNERLFDLIGRRFDWE